MTPKRARELSEWLGRVSLDNPFSAEIQEALRFLKAWADGPEAKPARNRLAGVVELGLVALRDHLRDHVNHSPEGAGRNLDSVARIDAALEEKAEPDHQNEEFRRGGGK